LGVVEFLNLAWDLARACINRKWSLREFWLKCAQLNGQTPLAVDKKELLK